MGDVFTLSPRENLYVFGRVVADDVTWAKTDPPLPAVNLVYLYRHTSPVAEVPPRAELLVDKLLLPPKMINNLPWVRGYFQTIGNVALGEGEKLPVHCFRDARGRFVDEFHEPLPARTEPWGILGLGSFRTIDDEVCDALGIPLAPD
ncbi:MAG: hypothetical protein HOY78_12360 [Saccharothrix sp.]|nr:hypothetical protein [Saccharothrix sp.]